MPYKVKGKCIYKKRPDGSAGTLVGCTKGDVKKYLQALYSNVKEIKLAEIAKGLIADKINNKKLK